MQKIKKHTYLMEKFRVTFSFTLKSTRLKYKIKRLSRKIINCKIYKINIHRYRPPHHRQFDP